MKTNALLIPLISAFLLTSCAEEKPSDKIANINTQITEDNAYSITWASSTPVDVFIADQPNASADNATLISDDDSDGIHVQARSDDTKRHYFVLRAQDGTTYHTAVRLLPLEGGRNFRDMGGYETLDGKHVRWGQLYRSGAMHQLTASDYNYISSLGIKVVCDLRTTEERETAPTQWAAPAVQSYTWDYAMDRRSFMGKLFQPGVDEAQALEIMQGFYRGVPALFVDRFKVIFDNLANGEIPLAFNCSAGKDRTGMTAALILSALGVPRETVINDYALSDKLVNYHKVIMNAENAENDPNAKMMQMLPKDVLKHMMSSDPSYMEAALDEIDTTYGGVDAYLKNEVGVTDEQLATIRQRLLQ